MGVVPSSLRAFPSLHRPTGKSFWKGGARGGRTFFQKGFPPRKLFPPNFRLLQIFRRPPPSLPRITFPLGNDQETTTPVSLPPGTVLLPGSGRHKGLGQAWVAVQHLIPAPTKNPRLLPGTINNTRRAGDLLCRAVAPNRLTPYGRLPAGRAAGDGRPLPFCTTGLETCITAKTKERPLPVVHDGTPQTSGSRRKGMQARTRRQRPVQARQGLRKLMPGDKKDPLAL